MTTHVSDHQGAEIPAEYHRRVTLLSGLRQAPESYSWKLTPIPL